MDFACSSGHLSIVEMLLNHDKDLLEIAVVDGSTPLLVAICDREFDIVRFLLDRGANVLATDRDGWTTLMAACCEHNLVIMRLLLAAGLDVEARNVRKQTALHCAALALSGETVHELILQHNANMFALDENGETPFDLISHWTDYKPIVDQLLEIYCSKITQGHGPLALHAILGAAHYVFVEKKGFHPPLKPLIQIRLPLGNLSLQYFRNLLSSLDTNLIRNRDENGKLPVHIACQNNARVEVLAMLIEIDAATLHIADHTGALPMHKCCCGVVDDSSVRFLVEQGGVGTLSARRREGS